LLNILIPVFNEELAVNSFLVETQKYLNNISDDYTYAYIFCNDGSTDNTVEVLIDSFAKLSISNYKIINLSKNYGKETALSAAINESDGDLAIMMDCDLQDPPSLIPQMINLYEEGFDQVIPVRSSRKEDGFLKLFFAKYFYKFFNLLSFHRIEENAGDFRLVSKKVLNSIKQYTETHRFMKGLLSLPGFKTKNIYFDRKARSEGKTKFSMYKMFLLALDGIFSFSLAPIRFALIIGVASLFLSVFFIFKIMLEKLIVGIPVPGYPTIICLVSFYGGLVLFCVGIISEYIGRTYIESKKRPLYFIDSIITK